MSLKSENIPPKIETTFVIRDAEESAQPGDIQFVAQMLAELLIEMEMKSQDAIRKTIQ